MLSPQYFQRGSEIELPEVASYIPDGETRFTVMDVLAGGMGVCVHLSQRDKGADFSLKCVRPEFIGNKVTLDRFHDELQVWLAASMCNHVAEALAVVRINEVPSMLGVWMQGGDLAHALPKLQPQEKFEALVRIIRALRWVYDNLKVIHRDLKPANVLLDKSGLAYVADWGLSRPVRHVLTSVNASLADGAIDRPDRTQAGSFFGTVLYAAPEQILNSKDVDHRADIYALGCMMFEFETGSPPFTGNSLTEIARQQLHAFPPQLGGWLRRTQLGLEDVIVKCLQKDPASRFSTYDTLEKTVVDIAKKRGFTLNRCTIAKRYERRQLGKGHLQQSKILKNASVKGTADYGLVEFDDISPFLEEANNLIALGRYRDAEVLLRPHFIPDVLNHAGDWHFGHSTALNYAYCLERIDGRLDDALEIFLGLNPLSGKPAEFYVNYSSALLNAAKAEAARAICETGLRNFPDDLHIMGNYTISLRSCGDLDRAQESALKRIKLRRDVHSIEEAVNVLGAQSRRKRDQNLPEAVF